MTAAIWSFVNLETGRLTGGQAMGGIEVGFCQPPNILPLLGNWSPDEWRYDLTLGRVVPLDPATDVQTSDQAHGQASVLRSAMQAAETATLRSLRDVILAVSDGAVPPDDALDRLREVDAEIAGLRAQLHAIGGGA